MIKDEETQKRICPEFRINDTGLSRRLLGMMFLLVGLGLVAWNVVIAVRGHNWATLIYALLGLVFIYGGAMDIGVDLREWFFALLHRRAWRGLQVTARADLLDCSAERQKGEYGSVYWTYWVTLRFNSTEGPAILKARISQPQYDRLQGAEAVTVRYALEDPRVALLEGEWED